MRRNDKTYRAFLIAYIAVLLYVSVAGTVFALRHPWMTPTEHFLWIGRALTFQRVTQQEVRAAE